MTKKLNISALLAVVLLVFGSTTGFTPPVAEGGAKYKSDEGKMQISFPAAYEVDCEDKDNGRTCKINAKSGDQVFFAAYTVHNTQMVEHEQMAEVSLESFAEKVGGETVSSGPWEVKGNKGRKAVINMREQDAICYYRVVLIGQIQYQVVYIAPKAQLDDKAADKFFKSFKPKK